MLLRIKLTYFMLMYVAVPVEGTGRLVDPAARSTLWRYGITPNVVNYNDHLLNCGGKQVQVDNGGQCGTCGDAVTLPQPRPNEDGGTYGLGTIAQTYTKGQVIDIRVELTVNQKGWFEFRLCDVAPATQPCLDGNLLQLGSGGTRYDVPHNGVTGFYDFTAQLPPNMTCDQCVLQWKYHTGKDWGCDADGTCCTGCGDQEEFYGCADVEITETTVSTDSTSTTTDAPTTTTSGGNTCVAVGAWAGNAGMDAWCQDNCNHTPPFCPSSHCSCS